MEAGDIYYNDDLGFHIIVIEIEKPYSGWCEVFMFQLSIKSLYPMNDIDQEKWGWRKLT